jgi:hypothetical protein
LSERGDRDPYGMTSMRAVAYRRVMKALCGIGAPELWPAERERVREAADALLLLRDLEEPDVRHALAAVPVLTDDLIDAERWTPLARAAAPATSGLAVRTSLGCSDGRITGASFRGGERDGGRESIPPPAGLSIRS